MLLYECDYIDASIETIHYSCDYGHYPLCILLGKQDLHLYSSMMTASMDEARPLDVVYNIL
jgi:hypothetical protein